MSALDGDVEIDNGCGDGSESDPEIDVNFKKSDTNFPKNDTNTTKNDTMSNDPDKYILKKHVGDNANVFSDRSFQKKDMIANYLGNSNWNKLSKPFVANAYLSHTHWRLNYAYANQRPQDVGSFRYEYNRLSSFDNRWLLLFPVTPIDLAKSGFYYLGPCDRVRCFSCKTILKRWEFGDSPITEHKRLAKMCLFLQNLDTENVPLKTMFSSEDTELYAIKNDESVGKYNEFEQRLKSFLVDEAKLRENAVHYAKCGFYLDTPEAVRCYKCNMKIVDLPDNVNDIYDAHSRDSPRCFFADIRNEALDVKKELKGTEDNQQKLYNNDINDDDIIITNAPNHKPEITKEIPKTNDILDSPSVAAMVDMGYSRDIITAAIEKHQNETGKDVNSASELFEAIEDIESEKRNVTSSEEKLTNIVLNASVILQSESSQTNNGKELSSPVELSEAIDNIKGENTKESTSEEKRTNNIFRTAPPSAELSSITLKSESSQTSDENKNICLICMDSEISISLHPCGHCLTCMKCSKDLKECPVCRHKISTKCRIYLP